MKNKIAKVIAIISIIMCICIFGNTSSAINVYNYNGRNIIYDIKSGSTVQSTMSNYFGSVTNLKELGIDVGENATPALIEKIYINFEKDNEQMQPGTEIETGDIFYDKQGKQYELAILGDLNYDGKVGVGDLLLLKKYLLGVPFKVSYSGNEVEVNPMSQDQNSAELELFKKIADLDKDGNVKTHDLVLLKKTLVGEDISNVDGDLNFDGVCDIQDYIIMLDVREEKYKLDVFQKEVSEYFDNMSTEEIQNYINKTLDYINNLAN